MPDRDRPLRVGILGAGWVAGARHTPIYKRDPRVEVVAVGDRCRERAERFAATHAIRFATDSLSEFIAQDLDLVSVCTPPFARREEVVALLDAGCNVFSEKPMAMTLGEAEAIAQAAEDNHRLLCVSHNFLYSRGIQRLRRQLASGEAGRIQFVIGVQASSPERRLPTWYGQLPAGLFFDESPHLFYILGGLLGDLEVVSAVAEAAEPGGPQPVRSIHAVMRSPTASATLTMAFETPVSEWHLIVICERLVLMVDLFRDISVVLGSDRAHEALDILRTSTRAGVQHIAGFAGSGARLAARKQWWGHDVLIRKVVDAVLSGGPSPVPVADSLNVVRVTDEILRAIAQPATSAAGH